MTWKQIERIRRKYERIHKRKIFNALQEQLKDVLKEVNVGILDVLPQKINTIVSDKSIKKAFYNLYNDVGWEFYQTGRKSLDDEVERSLWDQTFEKVIEAETGSRITFITDYSKEILMNTAKDVLRIGQEQGLGVMEMERLLRERLTTDFTRFSRLRSLRIVQTEVMSASNYATMKAGNESGLNMLKVWLTAPIGVAKTERHAVIPGLDGQKRRKGEPFNVGGVMMQYPGNGPADQVINCRCSLSWEPIEDSLII
jgi:hypothetical protein